MTFKYLTFFVFILTKTITTKLAHEWKKHLKLMKLYITNELLKRDKFKIIFIF